MAIQRFLSFSEVWKSYFETEAYRNQIVEWLHSSKTLIAYI